MDARSVRDAYTRWAPHYDATHSGTMPKREEARLALEIHPGDRVLDLACGTGQNLPQLREMVGGGGQVVGVDLTPAMLEVARERISLGGGINVEVHEADAAAVSAIQRPRRVARTSSGHLSPGRSTANSQVRLRSTSAAQSTIAVAAGVT